MDITVINRYLPLLIIVLTSITSIMSFNNRELTDKLIFNPRAIIKEQQWYRVVSSAFLHADWLHLIFNMYTLYLFSYPLLNYFGAWRYLIIYFSSIVGGGLLSLFVHRKNDYYLALGASGGVVGILFAAIALFPNNGIGLLFIPGHIPGWIFGIIYLFFSVYGMRNSVGNIGHDAHIGGALFGLLFTIFFSPSIISIHGVYIGLMLIPLGILGILLWKGKL